MADAQPEILTAASLGAADIVIIVGYFVIVLGIGFFVARRTKSQEDLFLGGRSFTWPFIGLSLFASNISSATIIGLAGAAYSTGIATSVYEWAAGIPMTIFALWFVPLYLDSLITTIPEFLQLRFSKHVRLTFSAINIILSIVIDTASGLYAGARAVDAFIPGISLWIMCPILAVIAGAYTAFGGLAAVVYTDAIQAIILIVGGTVLSAILFSHETLNWSLEALISSAPPGHFSLYKPADDGTLPWPALIFAVPMLGFYYWTTNQYISQRVLGSKNSLHARWGLILGSFLKLVPLFIMVIPGAMMRSIVPDIADDRTDSVFPIAVVNFLPTGLVGLVMAGLIASIMSTVDSTLNSASTLVVHDFGKAIRPKMTDAQGLKLGRVFTLIFMIFSAFWAPLIANFQDLWTYLQSVLGIIAPSVIVLFSVGVAWPRGNWKGAMACLGVGITLGLIMFILNIIEDADGNPINPLHFTYSVPISYAAGAITFIIVSLLTEAPNYEDIQPFVIRRGLITSGMKGIPWYKDYRFYLVLLWIALILHYALLTA